MLSVSNVVIRRGNARIITGPFSTYVGSLSFLGRASSSDRLPVFSPNRTRVIFSVETEIKASRKWRESFPQGLVLPSDLTAFGETCRLGRRLQRRDPSPSSPRSIRISRAMQLLLLFSLLRCFSRPPTRIAFPWQNCVDRSTSARFISFLPRNWTKLSHP